MNILMFSHYSESSGDHVLAGRLRSLRVEFQRLGHSVHFLYFDIFNNIKPAERVALKGEFQSFNHLFIKALSRLKSKRQAIKADPGLQEGVGARIAELCKKMQPDVVISTFGFSCSLFDHAPVDAVRVVDTFGTNLVARLRTH